MLYPRTFLASVTLNASSLSAPATPHRTTGTTATRR